MWRTKVPFVSMWWTVLAMYAGAGIDKATLQPFVNQRQTFQNAFFDYITLLDIDYNASFRCKCHRPEGCLEVDSEPTELIGDGITLGYRGDLSFFISPYTVDTAAPLKTGSLHQHRTFVTDPQIRSLLLRFSHAPSRSAVGLSEAELTQLRDSLKQSSAKHLGFLLVGPREQQGKLYCRQEFAEFVKAASVPQAAAVLLPQSSEPIVEHLLNSEHRKFATLGQSRDLAERAPVLSRFVQNQLAHGGNRLSDEAVCLLKDLLTVARKAYVEEPIDIFRKLKKRKPTEAPLVPKTTGES